MEEGTVAELETIAAISLVFSRALGEPIPAERLAVWQAVLADVPDAVLKAAALKIVRESVRPGLPTPGALYQASLNMGRMDYPTPGEAWEMAVKAVDACGYMEGHGATAESGWKPVHNLPNPVRRAVEQVGVMTIARGDRSAAVRARFVEFYEAMMHRISDADLFAVAERLALPAVARLPLFAPAKEGDGD
jgi:hypothetical protein